MPLPRFEPPWRGVFENWSKEWVRKHYWRVSPWVPSQEDALQECGVLFARCIQRYGDEVVSPKHFMALYKTAVFNRWHSLATGNMEYREVFVDDISEYNVYEESDDVVGPVQNDGMLIVAMKELPEHVKEVLNAMMELSDEMLYWVMAPRKRRPHEPQGVSANRTMRRLYGLSRHQIDLIGIFRELFTP
jgi:hypothetical protein